MTNLSHKPHFHHLKTKWSERHQKLHKSLWEKHRESLEWFRDASKQMAFGSVASLVLLTHPIASSTLAHDLLHMYKQRHVLESQHIDKTAQLAVALSSSVPEQVQALTEQEEYSISQMLSNHFQMKVTPVLDNKRLNRSYGYIGAEQHLMRYPGDTMESHFQTPEEHKYYSSGMAPGRGAWGYFTQSGQALTEKDIEREKYYIAVQTFLAPGWHDHVREYYEFFKYRKMLVVNPENGKAMVVVIGDAGPAVFTGKSLGGSPEVMNYLERQDGGAKGPVLYFFIDDPDDTIPLGPVNQSLYEKTFL